MCHYFLKLSFFSQPYREIFEFFIDNFKTYKPLLSAIKNEYEATLGKLLNFGGGILTEMSYTADKFCWIYIESKHSKNIERENSSVEVEYVWHTYVSTDKTIFLAH